MTTILWPKIVMASGLGLLCLPWPQSKIRKWMADTGAITVGLWFLAIRIAVCLAVFIILGMRLPTDLRSYFYPQATSVLDGMIPHIDFETSYNVGFPYLIAASTAVVRSPLGIVLLMILAEWAAFLICTRLLRENGRETDSRVLTWWFVNPVSVIYIALGGQDEALILLTVCVSLWLVYRNRDAMAGVTAVTGFMFTKLLSGIALVPWLAFPFARTGRAWVITGIGAVLIASISWLTPFQIIGAAREIGKTSAGNLWTLAAEILGPGYRVNGSWSYAAYPLLLVPVLWVCVRRPWELGSQVWRVWGLSGVLFMMLSPKTYGMYVVMFLPAAIWLCTTLPRRLAMVYGVVFWPLVVIEQTLWFHVGKEAVIYQASELRVLMIAVDVLLVCGNIGLVRQGLRRTEPVPMGLRE